MIIIIVVSDEVFYMVFHIVISSLFAFVMYFCLLVLLLRLFLALEQLLRIFGASLTMLPLMMIKGLKQLLYSLLKTYSIDLSLTL